MSLHQIIRLSQMYAEARNLRLSTVGRLALNDGKFFKRLEQGHSCTVARLERLLHWLAANWPENLLWPEFAYRAGLTWSILIKSSPSHLADHPLSQCDLGKITIKP